MSTSNTQQSTQPTNAPGVVDLTNLDALSAATLVDPTLPHTGRRLNEEQQSENQAVIDASVRTVEAMKAEIKRLRARDQYLTGRNEQLRSDKAELDNRVSILEGFTWGVPGLVAAVFAVGSASGYDKDVTDVTVDTDTVSYRFGDGQQATHVVPAFGEQQHTIRVGDRATTQTVPNGEIGFGVSLTTVRGLPYSRPGKTKLLGALSLGSGPASVLDELMNVLGALPGIPGVCPDCQQAHFPFTGEPSSKDKFSLGGFRSF